ncbi:hypothetical protein CERZMDRAFT_97717 [Cercospora zeae-maydis SCOH1-5]|uniref:Uncharacterized protein n=1 Tax=Cercospora zeae-maydis SCOH1-5 TaxID=717836 RepID=A0A6A6FG44_9PEZI|nr:hypothetical protein CERZMDRAFT_97717 [Cercospora zeae-maydis SCOH1-5]
MRCSALFGLLLWCGHAIAHVPVNQVELQIVNYQLLRYFAQAAMVTYLEQDLTFATYCRSRPDCTEALQSALSHEVVKIATDPNYRIDRREKLDAESFQPKMLKGSRMVAARTIAHTMQIRNATMPWQQSGEEGDQAKSMEKTLGILVRMAGKDNWSHHSFKKAMRKSSQSYRDIYQAMKEPEVRKLASKSTFMQGVIAYNTCAGDSFICTLPPHKKDYLARLINSNLEPGVLEEHDWLHRVMLLTRQGGSTDVWKDFKMPKFKHKKRTSKRVNELMKSIRNEASINAESAKTLDRQRVYHLDNAFDPAFGRLRSFSVKLNETLPISDGLKDLGYRRFAVVNGTGHPLGAHYMRLPGDLRIEQDADWHPMPMGQVNASFPVPEHVMKGAQKNLAKPAQHQTWFTDSRHHPLPTTLQQSTIPTRLKLRADPSPLAEISNDKDQTIDPQVLNDTKSTDEALDWYGPIWWPPEDAMRDLSTGLYRHWGIFSENTAPSSFRSSLRDMLEGIIESMKITRFPGTGSVLEGHWALQYLGARIKDVAVDAMNLPLVRGVHLGTGKASMYSTEPITEASTGNLALRFKNAHSLTDVAEGHVSLFDHAADQARQIFSWPRWAANTKEWQQQVKSWRSPSTRMVANTVFETLTEAEDTVLAGTFMREGEAVVQPLMRGVANGFTAQLQAKLASSVAEEVAQAGVWASEYLLTFTAYAADGLGALGWLLIPIFIGLEFKGDCKRPERYTSAWHGKGTSKMPLVQPCTHASMTRWTSIYMPNSTTTVSTPASNTRSITFSQVVQTEVPNDSALKNHMFERSVQHTDSSSDCLDPKTADLPDDLVWQPLNDGTSCWRAVPKECTSEGKLTSIPTEDGYPLYCKDSNALTGHNKAKMNNCFAQPNSQACQTLFQASFKSEAPQVTTIVSRNITMTTTIMNQTAFLTPKATTSTVSCPNPMWDMPVGYTSTSKTGAPCPVRTPFECTDTWFHENTNWLPKEVRNPRYCTEGDPTGHQRATKDKCIKEPGSKKKWGKKCRKAYINPPKKG